MKNLALICILFASPGLAADLVYAPEPVDNPLSGLVPYVGADGRTQFPHSMEFRSLALDQLMTGPGQFDWSPIESTLKETSGRGNQLIFRVYLEYPGKGTSVPRFLIDQGVKINQWKSPDGECHTPDYDAPILQRAMVDFITAMGKQYDGDPRIGFVTAGMLGLWGEWHSYPRVDLHPSKEAQSLVMDAFVGSFKKTHVLLRYPAGKNNAHYAANHERPFGYHDDSFAWTTLDTGKPEDAWYFLPSMKTAGASTKWKTRAIGGEIRPELWDGIFTANPHAKEQDFAKCVAETHVSWLMDTALYQSSKPPSKNRVARATVAVRQMGYELHVSRASLKNGKLMLAIENRGVAPFYYDWPIEVRCSAPNFRTRPLFPDWKLSQVLPGQTVNWEVDLGATGNVSVRVRVANPMAGGKPLRFANQEMKGEWLELSF